MHFIHLYYPLPNISKIVWPYIDKKLEEPKRRRRLKRGQYLEKFFPKNDYPNLKKKQFRNFLEHFDERLDNWDETDQAHNIVMDSVGKNTVSGNVTIMQNFDLHTYEIRYYNGTKTETADIRAIYYEIEKLCQQIPGAFAEIYKRPLDFYKHFIEL